MARVYTRERGDVVERGFLRLLGRDASTDQNWKQYAKSVLVFTGAFSVFLYGLLRLQGHLFLNPDHLPAVPWDIALNTTASFVTNTNWQYYAGEATMSYLSQMAGLAVQQFVSAGVGLAVVAAIIRGIARRGGGVGLGNFWRDLYCSIVYILLPLSILLAIVLISQGVPQTFRGHVTATTLQGAHQTITRGPVGSMIAIKQLGTNGGGWYDSNSAVPFENPTAISNFFEMLAILLIPFAQVVMFGRMVLARRHAWVLYSVCFAIFALGVSVAFPSEQHGSAVLRQSGVNITHSASQVGGNMTDKEVRFGIANTALWATATTDVSNGSVNGGHDAFTPAGGAVPLINMFLGEVEPGGVGSGLYGLFFYVLIAVFVAGLMVGRTPEWLGKKIEAREMKLAAVGALAVPTMVLVMTAAAIATKAGLASVFNPVPMASPRRSTRTRRNRTTTAALSRATPRRRSRRRWAPSPSISAASSHCSPGWRSAARSR
jgi:K+-transporting ATPase ATPase A chain